MQIGRIFNHYLEEQIINTDSFLLILVCIYFRGDLTLSIKIILKKCIIPLKSSAETSFNDSCKVTV